MVEIERKFLVTSMAFKDEAYKQTHITQGFLSTDPERTVRVRLRDEKGILAVKGKSSDDGLSRFEWEKSIMKREPSRNIKSFFEKRTRVMFFCIFQSSGS